MVEAPETVVEPGQVTEESNAAQAELDRGYWVICWDDPVNLMDYVTHVFQVVFGWPLEKAERHMLEVHHQGRSILVCEPLERAEHYVHQLHHYRLQATLERAS